MTPPLTLHHRLYFTIIFTTGFCSLGYQVIWQRYLSVLVGSHARSSTIIIAVFLLGLALGYYAFGFLAKRLKDRYFLLKTYGFVEILTGLYALLFPMLFRFFLESSFSQTNSFWIHLLMSGLLLIPATFLMGATVPIMTTVLPERQENVNLIHSRIYGLNTLGAFLGTLVTGLYLIPKFGYELSLIGLGGLNILVSLFYIKNTLSGPSYEKQAPEVVLHVFNEKLLYALGFVAGLTSLSLEVLWFRILGLTIGNSFIVFPFVLSIFVLMIGLGSLTLKRIHVRGFQNAVTYSLLFSFLAFLSVPYLPLIVSHIRVSFVNHVLAFYLYHLLVYLFLLCVLSPSIFYLGRLLPFVYSMLQKDRQNYGLKVGYLYFLNTLGTFLGAIVLGYLAFHWFGLRAIYFLTLGSLLILGLYFLKSRWVSRGLVVVFALVVVLVPFSRKYHEVGMFRERVVVFGEHFKNIISQTNQPKKERNKAYFKDGPNATVSVLTYSNSQGEIKSKSVIVNGKSDGNSVYDYGTMSLVCIIPYIVTEGRQLKTLTIGLGTGISAGVFTSLLRVAQVDVVEISDAVIGSVESMSPDNLNFYKSPKATIYQSDAFQLLKSLDDKYDIVLSEASNPWVVGVENLYTPYFYEIVRKQLTKDGILSQWFHTYSMSIKAIVTVLSNLKKTFKQVNVFETAKGDVVFLASNRDEPLQVGSYSNRMEPEVSEILSKLRIERISDIGFYEAYNNREVEAIIETNPSLVHGIFHPTLNKEAYFHFFSGHFVELDSLLDPIYLRILGTRESFFTQRGRIKEVIRETSCKTKKDKPNYPNFPCLFLKSSYSKALKNINSSKVRKRIMAYSKLRDRGLIKKDPSFFKEAMSNLPSIENKKSVVKTFRLVINELIKDMEYVLAKDFIQILESKGFIDKEEAKEYLDECESIRQKQERLLVTLKN